MAFIEFDVRQPVIRFNAGRLTNEPSWTVSFELYFSESLFGESVRIKTEEETLHNLHGSLGFAVRGGNQETGERGELYYSAAYDDPIFPSPANYMVSLWVGRDECDRLIDLIKSGVPLSKLSIETGEGIEYGWEPDGRSKEWDNAAHPKVSVSGFSLRFGADGEDVSDDEITPSKSILSEPPAPDTFKRDALLRLDQLNSRLGWLLAVLTLLAVASLVRH